MEDRSASVSDCCAQISVALNHASVIGIVFRKLRVAVEQDFEMLKPSFCVCERDGSSFASWHGH